MTDEFDKRMERDAVKLLKEIMHRRHWTPDVRDEIAGFFKAIVLREVKNKVRRLK